mmetsp:Transcript_41733/g.69710  ORF Transcript_41733/g.69710 Transcript_41733/m.69710 type:complete len:146 (-) Transcript_41733:619-1056(-)
MDGEPTALTIYNDFFFDERIVAHKAEIEKQIMQLWERVRDRIHRKSQNYCIDFALAASLEKIFIIEVNNFVAPVAGSGLFDYHKEADRKVLRSVHVLQKGRIHPPSPNTHTHHITSHYIRCARQAVLFFFTQFQAYRCPVVHNCH